MHTGERLAEIQYRAEKEARVRKSTIGHIWIGQYRSALRNSILICDNNWCWLTINLPPKRAIESISLELKSGVLLDDCLVHFDSTWNATYTIKRKILLGGDK